MRRALLLQIRGRPPGPRDLVPDERLGKPTPGPRTDPGAVGFPEITMRSGTGHVRRGGILVSLSSFLVLLGGALPALAQKTDVIVLFNGDRVTCEIKSYSNGSLNVSTDIASDIAIKWNKIVSIASDKQFEIQTSDGYYHYGMLSPSTPPGRLDIVDEEKTETVGFLDVVRLAPLYQTFWKRIDGSVDLGFNYTQASQFVQFTFNASANVRRPAFATYTDLSMFFTSQQGVPSSQRANLSWSYQKFLKERWSIAGGIALNRNLDLGLDLRVSLLAAAGRDLVRTNQTSLTAFAGLSADREYPVQGGGTYNLTALLAARYSAFTYDFPKVTVGGTLSVFPYLTDAGRIRVEFQASAKREIVKDFYLSLALFDSFDSRDPTTQQAKNDWGPVLAIGWSF
jgi:hypothetical protein